MFRRLKNYILLKFFFYFISDLKLYLQRLESQFLDDDYYTYGFDSLDEYLSFTDKYVKEISITRSWVASYETFWKNENIFS